MLECSQHRMVLVNGHAITHQIRSDYPCTTRPTKVGSDRSLKSQYYKIYDLTRTTVLFGLRIRPDDSHVFWLQLVSTFRFHILQSLNPRRIATTSYDAYRTTKSSSPPQPTDTNTILLKSSFLRNSRSAENDSQLSTPQTLFPSPVTMLRCFLL